MSNRKLPDIVTIQWRMIDGRDSQGLQLWNIEITHASGLRWVALSARVVADWLREHDAVWIPGIECRWMLRKGGA